MGSKPYCENLTKKIEEGIKAELLRSIKEKSEECDSTIDEIGELYKI